jgi:tRNA(Ile2) C34 agmatinyltransferase TiaS
MLGDGYCRECANTKHREQYAKRKARREPCEVCGGALAETGSYRCKWCEERAKKLRRPAVVP